MPTLPLFKRRQVLAPGGAGVVGFLSGGERFQQALSARMSLLLRSLRKGPRLLLHNLHSQLKAPKRRVMGRIYTLALSISNFSLGQPM